MKSVLGQPRGGNLGSGNPSGRRVRGTQSLVHMLGACWRRPRLLALEVGWRWAFGIPALALIAYEGMRVLGRVPLAQTGILNASLLDPSAAAETVAAALDQLIPPVLHIALWLCPLLAVGWAVVSGLGRSVLLKRLDPAMHFARGTLVALQFLRIVAYGALFVSWWLSLRWAANATLAAGEQNLVAYLAWVIFLSLGSFTLWALISWVFSIAPMIAMLQGRGVGGSLWASLRLGRLTGKLVEVNLVLNIVKLALIVVAMVLSSIALPFTSSMTGTPLYAWWAAISVLYMVASDFFQVARLAAFVEFWHAYQEAGE